ncbi:MAG TPA: lysophospholipid acyltransferase family protein [Coxiellaceae bacterium]|nr:lysophospholipid acyltransferase family protein [Coxiellaceae bacterium]
MNSAEKVKHYLNQIEPTPMGRFFYRFIPFRRPIVMANIALILGETLNEAEQIKLAQCFYGHLAKFVKENLKLRFSSTKAVRDQVDIRGLEYLLTAMHKDKGVLILSGHFGNWEFTPVGAFLQLSEQFRSKKLYCIRKTFSHKTVDDLVFRPFRKAGIGVIPKEKGLRQTVKALRDSNAVIIVFDQHSSPGKEGIKAEFFNKPAGTYRSLAKLAKTTEAAVIPVSYYRLSSGRQVLEFHPEIPFMQHPDAEEEQRLNSQAYNNFIEQAIVAHPEQWIWMHRRWRKFS